MTNAIEKLRKWLDYKVNRFDPYKNTIVLNTGAHPDELYDITDEIEAIYMRLPLDADGVPIKPGDTVECDTLASGGFAVLAVNRDFWVDKNGIEHNPEFTRHVKPYTVENLLIEFGDWYKYMKGSCDEPGIVAAYAERIREAVEK